MRSEWDSGLRDLRIVEDYSIRQLKLKGVTQINFSPLNDLEWLILAQHYGIPTRLLDWTGNPFVALFFACNADLSTDGAVYNLVGPKWLDLDNAIDPFEIDQDYYYQPRHFLPRLAAQSSFFTISSNPLIPLDDRYGLVEFQGKQLERIAKIIVAANAKEAILKQLLDFGVGWANLFPGLDGLCREISMNVTSLRQGVLSFSGASRRPS